MTSSGPEEGGPARTSSALPSVSSGGPARPGRESSGPAESAFPGEDFLFHLYRGSELLQDNCVDEARVELERAVTLQPNDPEARGLLAAAHFQQGSYSRALELYRGIVHDCPHDQNAKLNLSLCYLRSDRLAEARALLEELVRMSGEHARAWGYLGLTLERTGDYGAAASAFERAGQPQLARRMQARTSDAPDTATIVAVSALDGFSEASFARVDVPREPPSPSSVPTPRRDSRAAKRPTSVEALIEARRLSEPESDASATQTSDGLVLIALRESFAVRTDRVRALSSSGQGLTQTPLRRRVRGRETEEPFAAPGPAWLLLRGAGTLLLEPGRERELSALELSGELLYVRESRLVAFDGAVRYENGRLSAADPGPVPMVQFAGRGLVVLEASVNLRALTVTATRSLTVRAATVLGWTGRLLGHAASSADGVSLGPGFVVFNGEGTVLVDDP